MKLIIFLTTILILIVNAPPAKAGGAFTLMGFIAFGGGLIFCRDGVSQRGNMKIFAKISVQLQPFETKNDAAFTYDNAIPNDKSTMTHFADTRSNKTVAIYGDSHALSGYFGIAKINRVYNVNTLLISRASSRMPITGLLLNNDNENRKIAEKILDILCKHNDINDVYIFCRAQWIYNDYKKRSVDFQELAQKYTDDEIFEMSMQYAIDKLVANKKKVFLVVDNPRLPKHITNYLPRPFRVSQDLQLKKSDVFETQSAYRQSLQRLKNVTIIETIDAFCPTENCKAFSTTGIPFYKDNDHLSFLGSEMLAEEVLKPYLLEKLPQEK